jgi:protein TonB
MRNTILYTGFMLSCFIAATSLHAQTTNKKDSIPDKADSENLYDRVFTKTEIEASFIGGEANWRKFLEKKLNASTPVDMGARPGTYTVICQFIVDTDGNISDLKTLTHHGYGMEEEVLRLMKTSPKWVPAMQNGRAVKAYRKQPITFIVTEG